MGDLTQRVVLSWTKERLLSDGLVLAQDMALFHVTDEPKEAAQIIQEFYQKQTVLTNF